MSQISDIKNYSETFRPFLITKELLNTYQKDDRILGKLNETSKDDDPSITTHQWLVNSLPKRMIFDYLYGDFLFDKSKHESLLDVGGAYTSLTRVLSKNVDYQVLDIMAHDPAEKFEKRRDALGPNYWINKDWYNFTPDRSYDCIIANDLFPNVDQRLDLFLQKYLPICREIRLSLTFYNTPKFYGVKRLDGEEVFFTLMWDGAQLNHVLRKYISRIDSKPLMDFQNLENPSLFPNGRQVALLSLRGNLA